MISDLMLKRKALWPHQDTQKWSSLLQGLSPRTRLLVQRFMQPGATLAEAAYPSFGLEPAAGQEGDNEAVLALAGLLMEATLDLCARMLREPEDLTGRAYEEYFREDFVPTVDIPPTVPEKFDRALQQGEPALAALVAEEAARRLGLSEPSAKLTAEVYRRIEPFKLLAVETRRMACEGDPSALAPFSGRATYELIAD